MLGIEGLTGFLDLFVPLTGRLGADAPVDFIIASLTAGVGFLAVPMVRDSVEIPIGLYRWLRPLFVQQIIPFSHRFGPKTTARIALFFTFVTAGMFHRPAGDACR